MNFYWSWLWRRRVTSTSMLRALGLATVATMVATIKDRNPLDKVQRLRMLAT